MKKVFLSIVAIAALVVIPMSVSAQSANNVKETVEADSKAVIIVPIAVATGTSTSSTTGANMLDFGTISSSNASGTVTIAATSAGARTNSGGVAALATSTYSSANFVVKGSSGNVVNLALVEGSFNVTGPGDVMAVVPTLSTATINLTGGDDPFYVGGTITVGASQAAGTYTGKFHVTAQYN